MAGILGPCHGSWQWNQWWVVPSLWRQLKKGDFTFPIFSWDTNLKDEMASTSLNSSWVGIYQWIQTFPGVGNPSGQDTQCSDPPLSPSDPSDQALRWSRGEKAISLPRCTLTSCQHLSGLDNSIRLSETAVGRERRSGHLPWFLLIFTSQNSIHPWGSDS